MVMQLHSWLEEHPNSTQLEIDNILDGNICRSGKILDLNGCYFDQFIRLSYPVVLLSFLKDLKVE